MYEFDICSKLTAMILSNALRLTFAVLAILPALAAGLDIQQPRPCPPNQSCVSTPPEKCEATHCFSSQEEQKAHEKKNNCTFATDNLCGGKPVNKATECCGKAPQTGQPRVVDKVMSKEVTQKIGSVDGGPINDVHYTWASYQKLCPNKKQNNAPPNALWKMCEKGKPETPGGYPIDEVRPNGTARPHCIDGCSIPGSVMSLAVLTGIFLVNDRNNPTGYATSSFKQACNGHDVCYQTCNNNDQLFCDTKLKNDSIAVCKTIPVGHQTSTLLGLVNTRKKCEGAAKEMFNRLSTKENGQAAFNLRRQQYCQCC